MTGHFLDPGSPSLPLNLTLGELIHVLMAKPAALKCLDELKDPFKRQNGTEGPKELWFMCASYTDM
jgi:hypothetical protein